MLKGIILVLLCVGSVFSQEKFKKTDNAEGTSPSIRPEKTQTLRDTLKKEIPKNNSFGSTVVYTADDSTLMDMDQEIIELFGNAVVSYDNIELKAGYIKLNWGLNEVYAHGLPDTTKITGDPVKGKPIFTQGNESYNTDTIRYNFKSKKAIIKGIVTQQGEGYVTGQTVKKDSTDNLYLSDAKYTTCNLKDPHFHIAAKKIKLVNKKSVVSGPFNFVLEDIPLPIGLPFGFFPVPKKKELGTSGFVMGDYGEDPQSRGFYFKDFGYYHAFNEYIGAKLLAQVYSRGSWGVGLQTNYLKRYKFGGNLNFQYNFNRATGDFPEEQDKSDSKDFKFSWSHSPQNNRPDRSFSSSINIATNSFDRNNTNTYDYNNYTRSTSNSSVRYSRNVGNLLRTSAGLSANQNFTTGEFNAGLTYNVGLNQFNPLVPERKQVGGFFDQFRVGLDISGGYTFSNDITSQSRSFTYTDYVVAGVTNEPLTEAEILANENGTGTSTIIQKFDSFEGFLDIVKNGDFTSTFSVPIALPNFKLGKAINLTPSVNLRGDLYTKKLNYTFIDSDSLGYTGIDTDLGAVVIDTTRGVFNSYSTSYGLSANTRVYGMYKFSGKRRLQAIRHTFAPSASFSFTPDLTDKFFQKTTVIKGDSARYLPIYDGLSSVARKNARISFGFANQLEAKLRTKSDTADTAFEKVQLLNNLSLRGSYNILADSMNLSNISLSANTSLFKNLININLGGTLDPYTYEVDTKNTANLAGKKVNKYKWNSGLEDPGKYLTSFNVALSTNLNPKTFGKEVNKPDPKPDDEASKAVAAFAARNPMAFVDFSIPWNLRLSYNVQYNKQGLADPIVKAVARFDGDFSLTDKWRFTYGTGYDFQFKAITLTNVGVIRDLHCWSMAFNWTPITGNSYRASSYSFTISARSSLLQDLKLMRRRQNFDLGGF